MAYDQPAKPGLISDRHTSPTEGGGDWTIQAAQEAWGSLAPRLDVPSKLTEVSQKPAEADIKPPRFDQTDAQKIFLTMTNPYPANLRELDDKFAEKVKAA